MRKLREAKTFSDIEDDLKEARVSRSALEIARTAYQVREQQPKVAEHFFATIVKETEDKKLQEYEGGASTQASNRADPLPHEEKKTPDGENPTTGATGTEDQMKEDIMGGIEPSIARSVMPQTMPSLNLPQQIKQMQYTIRQAISPILKELREIKLENSRLREAYKALDKKMIETTQTLSTKSMTLDVGKFGKTGRVQETNFIQPTVTPSKPLEERRYEISELNRLMNLGQVPKVD